MRARLTAALLVLLLSTINDPLSTVQAQGMAFTYQGQLQNGGSPVTGFYDLKVDLFNAATGGSVIDGPVTNFSVAVTNGLFTTLVDFGTGVFTGGSNWLRLQVRTNAKLDPRPA